MSEPKTVVVIGIGKAEDLNMEIRAGLMKEFGNDVIILSESEAKEQNPDIPSVSTFKFEMPLTFRETKKNMKN